MTRGRGADVVLHMANTPASFIEGIEMLKRGGVSIPARRGRLLGPGGLFRMFSLIIGCIFLNHIGDCGIVFLLDDGLVIGCIFS